MISSSIVWSIALAAALVNAADEPPSSTPLGSLYAYGTGIDGLPIIYSDGVAVLGWGVPSFADVATNVSFTQSNSSLTAQPNSTDLENEWSNSLLYIDTHPGGMSDVGFTTSSNTSYTTTGFDFWGRQLLWLGEDESAGVGRSFWASPMVGNDEFYKLFWNADNQAISDSVPVVIKRLPPP
ncbi:hypothetical protein Q7P37_000197 [Cladosporium fusiforme]